MKTTMMMPSMIIACCHAKVKTVCWLKLPGGGEWLLPTQWWGVTPVYHSIFLFQISTIFNPIFDINDNIKCVNGVFLKKNISSFEIMRLYIKKE